MIGIDNSASRTTLLIVEDDQIFLEEFSEFLRSTGFETQTVSDAAELAARIDLCRPSVVVLDQFLGTRNMLYAIPQIKEYYDGGIVIVTNNADELDRIIALETGADDFIHKLQPSREIAARLRAVARRISGRQRIFPEAEPPPTDRQSPERFPRTADDSGWMFDPLRGKIAAPSGAQVELTRMESTILMKFLEAGERVVSREELHTAVQRPGAWTPTDRGIDNSISRLRKFLLPFVNDPMIVRSIRGQGYAYTGPRMKITALSGPVTQGRVDTEAP